MKKKYITPYAETCCTIPTPLLGYSVNRFENVSKKTVGDTEEDTPKQTKNSLWNPITNN